MYENLSKGLKNKIISASNMKSYRERHGIFVAEGIKCVKEAVNSDYRIEFIAVSESFVRSKNDFLKEMNKKGIRVYHLSDEDFKNISSTESPQGVIALIRKRDIEPLNLIKEDVLNPSPMFIALEDVRDPGNVGTIVRTADAAEVKAVILSNGCADLYNPKTVRSTMGSIFHMEISEVEDFTKTLREFKKKGIKLFTADIRAKRIYFDLDFTVPFVLVLGNESRGVSKKVLEISDELIKIPISTRTDSLNVAVAASIIIFEAVRQRKILSPCK